MSKILRKITKKYKNKKKSKINIQHQIEDSDGINIIDDSSADDTVYDTDTDSDKIELVHDYVKELPNGSFFCMLPDVANDFLTIDNISDIQQDVVILKDKVYNLKTKIEESLWMDDKDSNILCDEIQNTLYNASKIHKSISQFASLHSTYDLTYEENELFKKIAYDVMEQIKIISELKNKNVEIKKNRINKTFQITYPGYDKNKIDECVHDAIYNEVGSDDILLGQLLNNRTSDAALALCYIREQHNEIKQIEKAISQLHEMAIDMNNLITAQGDILNSIEVQLDGCKKYSSVGLQMLQSAETNKISSRKKKIITGIIIAAVASIVVLTIAGIVAGVICLCT